tara:strand:- start:414 stop:1442 length:1029 start_codon:yes stop_codon:yes gene_type:complete
MKTSRAGLLLKYGAKLHEMYQTLSGGSFNSLRVSAPRDRNRRNSSGKNSSGTNGDEISKTGGHEDCSSEDTARNLDDMFDDLLRSVLNIQDSEALTDERREEERRKWESLTLESLGLDSVNTVKLSALMKQSGYTLPIQQWTTCTVGELKKALMQTSTIHDHSPDGAAESLKPSFNMESDCKMSGSDMDFLGKNWKEETGAPRRIFLTGATGYLGIFILCTALHYHRSLYCKSNPANSAKSQSMISVTCLVRAKTVEEGLERILNTAKLYHLDTFLDVSRVSVICGDLSLPLFGLTEDAFNSLKTSCDRVIHNGCRGTYFYRTFWAFQTAGTNYLEISIPNS